MDTADHLLVVDDDRDIRELLTNYLTRNGFRATAVADGRAMRAALAAHAFDLVVLDVMLPGEDGLTLCRELRARSNLPILMLTARGDDLDRIVGLEMGADDYLPKPFNPRELLARIKAVLRRARSLPDNLHAPQHSFARFDGWTLNFDTRTLHDPAGEAVELSGAEFRLLKIFVERPHRVLNRDQLMDLLHGRDTEPFDRSIDVQVSRLRQRLGDDAREARLIKTVRGEGYVFTAPVSLSGEPACD
ncbi:DNA-binding response regulator [Aquaspirillum sp. LM1]|jgi:two-component system OmpR family response regulator|uniref:response regulator n=1 Tax=Aquaspirillum sp. LM1 TaxID=1938604 RepID=UPI000983DF64|nr:response regulator [Aquaspirillum sp. LM1]AQR65867.1 DNA-binding response regulator [Aquaspirillum sp. LM1]